MHYKQLLALVVFFGNLLAMVLTEQAKDISAGRMLLTGRQRFILRLNEVMMYVAFLLMLIYLYVVICR